MSDLPTVIAEATASENIGVSEGTKKPSGTRFRKLTPQKKKKFLTLLANNGGVFTRAARQIGVSNQALYKERLKDKEFAAAWLEALDHGIDVLEAEAVERAVNGTEKPIYYKGEIVGTIMEKSDSLIQFLLRGHRVRYRDRHEITGADGAPLSGSVMIYHLPDNGRGDSTAPVEVPSRPAQETTQPTQESSPLTQESSSTTQGTSVDYLETDASS